jgi:hypothetical protein
MVRLSNVVYNHCVISYLQLCLIMSIIQIFLRAVHRMFCVDDEEMDVLTAKLLIRYWVEIAVEDVDELRKRQVIDVCESILCEAVEQLKHTADMFEVSLYMKMATQYQLRWLQYTCEVQATSIDGKFCIQQHRYFYDMTSLH